MSSSSSIHTLAEKPVSSNASTVSVGEKEKESDSVSVSIPDKESVPSSTIEQGLSSNWEDYRDDTLPDKEHGHYLRNLRYQVFIIYRRLFGIVFVANMGAFIGTAIKGSFDAQTLGLIVIANIFAAVLIRQEHVVNVLFEIFCSVPTSWPLIIRTTCARIYSLGGIHSGSAISGIVWLIFFTVQATREVAGSGKTSPATLAVTYVILMLLITMVVFAYPRFRSVAHDKFERTHRFLGWTAVGLVWALVILLTNDYREPDQTLGHSLVKTTAFWLVVVLTGSIILPWLNLRKYPVRAERLSEHALRLYFDYGASAVPGSFIRISKTTPVKEWHSFATVALPGQENEGRYSVIISRAGDWTSEIIDNPPTHMYVRGVATSGAMRVVPMFRRVVLVATGSGIAPIAPHVLAKRNAIRLLWVSMTVRETFGDKLVDDLLEAEPGAVIYDTRKHGRPDMVKLCNRMYTEFNAEAVCIISNQRLTQKVVYGLMSRGIPAFGAIWDS